MMVSDDQFLKELAANEWAVRGVSSFDLLMHGATSGQLSKDEFERATIVMIQWGFRETPIRAETILVALRASGHDIDGSTRALLDVLVPVSIDVAAAVRVAAEVLREIWLSPMLLHKLHSVTDALLEALVRNRGPAILEQLKPVVASSLRLAPQYGRRLIEHINEFARRRYAGEIIP